MMHKSLYKIFHYIDSYEKNYIDKIDKKIILIYRNYHKTENIKDLLKLRKHCNQKGIKIILSNNIKLAYKLKFDGVYLPAFNHHPINKIKFRKNFMILGSAHNLKELKKKEKQNVNQIFLSPLFATKNKKPIGLNRFRNIAKYAQNHIIALGGINSKNMNKLNLTNAKGFASINYIKEKYAF